MMWVIDQEAVLLYILWGEDQFSLEEALQEIKNSLGNVSLLSTNTSVLEGQKLAVNELKAVGEALPFLAPKRLVIVKGLLERFESKEKSSRSKKTNGQSSTQDESQALAECIKGLPESTILVLTDTIEVKKSSLQSNPLFNAIADRAEVKSFPLLKGVKLSQWIQARVNKGGGGISQQATNLLMEIVGSDLYTMANEINKLVAYTAGRLIEEKDIRMVVSASREADIFAMIDAIMECKVSVAEKILQKLLQNGVVAPQILVLLGRQVQMLVQVKELRRLKRPAAEIQARLGVLNSFAWERMARRADTYTLDKLKEIYQSLLEADLAIKTGRFEGDLAMNVLVADLCHRKAA